LALRLIDAGASLVADDRVEVRVEQGRLLASCPPALAGLLEVRGVGILRMPHESVTEVRLVVDLVAPETVERLPEPESTVVEGCSLPRLALAPFPASAAAKIRLAAAAVRGGVLGRIPEPT
jgi:serine kinase of HPr protein (carbohydrate metabolism regulator)